MAVEEKSEAPVFDGSGRMIGEGGRRGGSVVLAGVRYALLLVAGLLTGAIFCVWLMERAFEGDGSFYTEFKQLQITALAVPLPALGLATLILGLAHLFLVRWDRFVVGLTLAGVLCFAVGGLAITIWGHFPINDRIMGWSAEAPPGEWTELAARWSLAHDLRTLFAVLGFALLLAGALRPLPLKRSTA